MRNPCLVSRLVEGRLQRDLHQRNDQGPPLVGVRRLGQVFTLANRGRNQFAQQVFGFGQPRPALRRAEEAVGFRSPDQVDPNIAPGLVSGGQVNYVKSLPKDIETSDPSRRAAYLRSDLFERRRKLMADWSTDG